jgi:hypothetical protein
LVIQKYEENQNVEIGEWGGSMKWRWRSDSVGRKISDEDRGVSSIDMRGSTRRSSEFRFGLRIAIMAASQFKQEGISDCTRGKRKVFSIPVACQCE